MTNVFRSRLLTPVKRYAKYSHIMDEAKQVAEFGSAIGTTEQDHQGHAHCPYCSGCVPAVFGGGTVEKVFGPDVAVCSTCCEENGIALPGNLTSASVNVDTDDTRHRIIEAQKAKKQA